MSKKAAPKAAPEQVEIKDLTPMNEHALRVWEGQSISLPLGERVRRIKAALIDQGFENELDALELPTTEDFKRYL